MFALTSLLFDNERKKTFSKERQGRVPLVQTIPPLLILQN